MKFADFEADAASGELRRNGERVRIQDLPFRVLIALLTRAGDVVTRDQLREELWGASTFVDAEAGLNTAIAKLREALGDSAEAPRFIETLPKRGYRFLVQPSVAGRAGPEARRPAAVQDDGGVQGSGVRSHAAPRADSIRRPLAIATMLLLAVIAFVVWRERSSHPRVTIAVVLFHNETGDAAYDQLAQQLTDGTVVALAASPRYAVIGNAAVLRTPRIFTDIQKIGTELHADYLVLGQIQRGADGLIVRAHFIQVRDQKHLWAKGIQGELSGLDSLVPQTVADAVDIALAKPPQ